MFDPDPLSDLLAPPPDGGPSAASRAAALARTLPVVRGRRRRPRRAAGLLALASAAGLLLILSPGDSQRPPAPTTARPAPDAAAPVALEWRALEQPASAAALYRRAGDGYLEASDPGNAARVYGLALQGAGPAGLAQNEDDSWLLTAIKLARIKEKTRCEEPSVE